MMRILVRKTALLEGPALHSGAYASVQIAPAPSGSGIIFTRYDLRPPRSVKANLNSHVPGLRRTVIRDADVSVNTVEHVLAALYGLNIWDAKVWVSGPELPILDGSAAPFGRELLFASEVITPQEQYGEIIRPFAQSKGACRVNLLPADSLIIESTIHFSESSGIGYQGLRVVFDDEHVFIARIAPARTFGLYSESSALRSAHLARGARLSNAVVFKEGRVLNPAGTRFYDECVRHKILDALGDLALLGFALKGRIKMYRCSHSFLVSTLKKGLAQGVIRRHR